MREDFNDSGWLVLKRFRRWVGPANDRGIGVIKADMAWQVDTDLRVGVECPAGPAAQAVGQGDKRVGGDQIVGVSCPRHGVNDAAEILMFHG